MYSDYFCNKIASIQDTLDRKATASPLHFVRFRLFSAVPFTHLDIVSEDCVRSVIMKMSPKTFNLDPVPATVLSDCVDDALPALANVVNCHFQLVLCQSI